MSRSKTKTKSRSLILSGLAIIISIFSGCGDEIITTLPAEEQFQKDKAIINDYIARKGYSFDPGDTTQSGVRFVIFDKGMGDTIEYGDIIDLYYVGSFTDDELFDTNIDTVDINNGTYDSLKSYTPTRFTHSQGGWALSSKGSSNYSSLVGYIEGVTVMMDSLNIGGHAKIILPSVLAYGTQVNALSTFRDRVLIFDLYPVYKR